MVTKMLSADQGMSQGLGTVLILEDEVLVSAMIEDLVLDLGAERAIVCNTLEQARQAVEGQGVQWAILDVLIGRQDSGEIADALAARGTPFLFASASGLETIGERHRHRPLLSKPFSNEQLRASVETAMSLPLLPAATRSLG
jgi:CheY-like chemotaxis protein